MNILYYDKDTDLDILWETGMMLKDHGIEVIAIPNTISLMMEVGIENLFNIADKIHTALELVKEEKPEEYNAAFKKRTLAVRDKIWREILDKANKENSEK